MSQAFPSLLLVLSVAWSCSGNTTRVTGTGTLRDTQTTDGAPYMSQDSADMMKDAESEKVVPPSQVTGSYLTCEEIPDTRLSRLKKKVGCSFQDAATGRNVDLVQNFRSHRWEFQTLVDIQAAITEFPSTDRFQVHFFLTASRRELLADDQFLSFKLVTEDEDGKEESFETSLSTQFVRWQKLNGAAVPALAVAGGTEENGKIPLHICRMYVGDLVVPGKVRDNGSNSPVRTVCYASYRGAYYESNIFGADEIAHRTDILVMNELSFDDVLEWVEMKDGERPDNAYTAGVDENYRPLYLCVANESGEGVSLPAGKSANSPQGEATPGVLAEGSQGCEYDFYGSKVKSQYRVLAWKSAKLKTLMDAANKAKPLK